MIDIVAVPPARRLVKRAVAGLVAVLMVTTLGLVASPTGAAAAAAKCSSLSCNGKWPGKQNCKPGKNAVKPNWNAYGRQRASIKLKVSNNCSSYWARLIWDGDGRQGMPPVRWQIKVARQSKGNVGWVVSQRHYRAIKNGAYNSTKPGAYVSKMVPFYYLSGYPQRVRACARWKSYTSSGWSGFTPWACTAWT